MLTTIEDKKPTLEEAQALVGGLVEMVRSPNNSEIQILVNEEGLLKGLPFNEEQLRFAERALLAMLLF